ncbi:activating signal cointegrator 1-like isoform X2 [Amphiura filiformis]
MSDEQLVQWCCEKLSQLLQTDTSEELATYLVSFDTPSDVEEYLQGLLDIKDSKHSKFIRDFIRRKWPVSADVAKAPDNVQVYRKSAQYESYATKTEKTKSSKGRSREKDKKSSSGYEKLDLASLHAQEMPGDPPVDMAALSKLAGGFKPIQVPTTNSTSQQEIAQAHKQGARRKQKYVSLYTQEGEAKTVVHLPGRHVCECQAQKHHLISNCLRCGRVVCAQEGSGPCLFCGALVCTRDEQEILSRNSNKSEKLRKKLLGDKPDTSNHVLPHAKVRQQDGLDKALAHKDKLLEFDKTSVRRTQVIDDESDYFAVDTNRWLSDQERDALKKRKQELHKQKHASRLDQKFTLDFAGRRVFEDDGSGVNMYDRNDAVVQAVNFGNPASRGSGDGNALINPTITQPPPKFVLEDRSSNSLSNRGGNSTTWQDQRSGQGQRTVRIQDRELLEMSDEGWCLSMHQPWATLLATGIKVHEGRTWYSSHRGRLWIASASKQPSPEEISEVENLHRLFHKEEHIEFPTHYPAGCLLGCVDMVDCLSQEQYRDQFPDGESSSPYVFIVENPQELVVRFPIKGKHKIWRLDTQVHKAAKTGLRARKH